jgi:phage N-6-adenine-methyltransferase
MSIHFSSQTDLWATPPDLFEAVNAVFGFELDVCATPDSAKCERFYSPQEDGLKQEWSGICWMNPPYGREIGRWMKKAYEAGEAGATVVCLVPARTDTRWWHDYASRGVVLFLKGRLRFGGAISSAPFPSALVVFCKTFDSELLQCLVCENVFAAKRSHAKVCGNRCQVRLHRRRLGDRAEINETCSTSSYRTVGG